MPTKSMEPVEPQPTKPEGHTVDTKQLAKYYTVLRDFMTYFHGKPALYEQSHEFTQEELKTITPEAICKWMRLKIYGKEDIVDGDEPKYGSHHTLDNYKKSISYFMPNKGRGWDSSKCAGNPTRSHQVNGLIKKVRTFDSDNGTAKKRKWLVGTTEDQKRAKSDLAPTTGSLNEQFANTLPQLHLASLPGSSHSLPLSRDESIGNMQGILHRMHAQNLSFISMFGSLSTSLDQFKHTLTAHNAGIMSEVQRLSFLKGLPYSFTPAPVYPAAASKPPASEASNAVDAGPSAVQTVMYEYFYPHPDGTRRRVPPSWTFPHKTMEEMYDLWHFGDSDNHICPMQKFTASDLSFMPKRSKQNYSEVRTLMQMIDEAATKKGVKVKSNMNSAETSEAFVAGMAGLPIVRTTPTGKSRDTTKLKWSTLIKYVQKQGKAARGDTGDGEKVSATGALEVPNASSLKSEENDGETKEEETDDKEGVEEVLSDVQI